MKKKEREMIVTYVSTYVGCKRQSNKADKDQINRQITKTYLLCCAALTIRSDNTS